jgi:hypothetical protein
MPAFTCPGCCGQLFFADPATAIICPRCGSRTPPPGRQDLAPGTIQHASGRKAIDFDALDAAVRDAATGCGSAEESAALARRLVRAAERLHGEAVRLRAAREQAGHSLRRSCYSG